jgi:hypothetical protein
MNYIYIYIYRTFDNNNCFFYSGIWDKVDESSKRGREKGTDLVNTMALFI